jgi:hypothetical protein
VRAPLLVSVILAFAVGCSGGDERVEATDEPSTSALALPRCDDVPEVSASSPPAELSADPAVAAWQQARAEVGLPSDEGSTVAAAEAQAVDPVEDLGFPMTAEEAEGFFAHQSGNGDLATEVQDAVGGEPWFGGVWLDNVAWSVGVAVTGDAGEHQRELDEQFGAGAVVAYGVERSEADLLALQARVSAHFQREGVGEGNGVNVLQNVVSVYLEVLDPAVVDALVADVGSEGLCVEGAELAEVVPEGPQPQAGEGWRLLADEPGIGRPYATGFAADPAAYAALWADIGLPGEPPAVDFDTEVVAWFGPAVSGSCPEIRMDDVVFDGATATLHPEIVLIGGARGCTDDANPHAYVVAVDRALLPDRFTVSVLPPNPDCCPEGTTEAEL